VGGTNPDGGVANPGSNGKAQGNLQIN